MRGVCKEMVDLIPLTDKQKLYITTSSMSILSLIDILDMRINKEIHIPYHPKWSFINSTQGTFYKLNQILNDKEKNKEL